MRERFFTQLPQRSVHSFVIDFNGTLIGYIQYYEASKVGNGWWPDETDGTFGIDLMIGSIDFVGKGFSTQIVKDFVGFMQDREPEIASVIIDPAPNNLRAIRAFEKAGFQKEKEIKTPGGLAFLMRMQLSTKK